ncbi:hypothetical protein ACOT81_24200 [Streptomyces sp. WI04-05B]|uniref:hypothetical protein n=1 Tax=Streptomyces TaxID=1883 RepID=UPI0029B5536F|nr:MULTISPECIES: hypothetical protein [unclassified Streptomyces]MDX2542874.1 hypothetical protein [Streptomyces sp. WI04-05B]MDX2588418.1 hypothetical protein [Streptomyces sp. WI04-05A]MDX3747272.1 hypothetical protein [Streptomyces sp. AK08-02]
MNLRLLALSGVVALTVALPLAVASAGPVGDADRDALLSLTPEAGPQEGPADDKAREAADPAADPTGSPLLGLGLATAARCGPELTSPDGIEAQTCVLSQGEETWARTYYRNATGRGLVSVLSLMGPDSHTVQLRCAVGAEDEPGVCETPRERTAGEPGAYTAVAEFAAAGNSTDEAEGAAAAGQGPLLLRSGSNSGAPEGS